MKYTPATEFRGGGLLGYLAGSVPYARLVELFGEPGLGDEYKVAFEWVIDFEDGKFARIYDWKETSMYDDELADKEAISDGKYIPEWHIGGEDQAVVERVNNIVAGESP